MAKSRGGGSGSSRIFLGFLVGVLAAGLAGYGYLRYSAPRGTIARRSSSVDKRPAPAPAKSRIEHPAAVVPPFGISEDVFEAGARVYRVECVRCHGTPTRNALPHREGAPGAMQLFSKQNRLASQQPGDIYRKIAGGVTGMPAYKHVLTDTQMWQVSLLLANAGKELPTPVTAILTAP